HRAQMPLLKAEQDWRASGRTRLLAADLYSYANDAPLAECDALSALFGDQHAALEWVRGLSAQLIQALRSEPLGDVPFRTHCSDSYSTLQLMSSGRATLSLTTHAPRSNSAAPETVMLVDRESIELVLAGKARGLMHKFDEHLEGRFETKEQDWQVGDTIALTPDNARHLLTIEQPVLMLHLTRAALVPGATRKYRLADGQLMQSANGDKQTSRNQLALAVLGAMQCQKAVPVLKRLSEDTSNEADLRWEAVRQNLAINPAKGFAMIDRLAEQADDPLARPASSLKAQLISAHPQLADLLPEAA
ncbi:hypothetical protein, partial [uncultured Erythrobacter sp.]